jgi:hypothetical protein
VSEVLFSAGAGCCFTQPRTPRFHHVPCSAVGHRIIIGAKAPYLNSKNQNPSSNLWPQTSRYTLDRWWPLTTGGYPRPLCHHGSHPFGTSSSPPIVYIYVFPPSPLYKPSRLLTTAVYSSVPVTPHNDGVARITPFQGGTSTSSS